MKNVKLMKVKFWWKKIERQQGNRGHKRTYLWTFRDSLIQKGKNNLYNLIHAKIIEYEVWKEQHHIFLIRQERPWEKISDN